MPNIFEVPLDQVLSVIPYLPAKYIREVKDGPNKYIVIHDMEAPERSLTAEGTARYFQSVTRPASTQMCVDNDSVVRCVPDQNGCYGASGLNFNGLHIEHAGYASQSREEWLDQFGKDMFAISARVTAAWCLKYNIPPEYVGVDGLLSGRPGFVTHADSTKAWNVSGGHTDPGNGFPMDYYMEQVRKNFYEFVGGKPPVAQEDNMSRFASVVNPKGFIEEFRIVVGVVKHRWQGEVVKDGKNPIKVGEKIPGKPKVRGDNEKNDVVPKKLDVGGVVIPNSVMQSDDPSGNAAKFVAKLMEKQNMGGGDHAQFKEALKKAISSRKAH